MSLIICDKIKVQYVCLLSIIVSSVVHHTTGTEQFHKEEKYEKENVIGVTCNRYGRLSGGMRKLSFNIHSDHVIDDFHGRVFSGVFDG